MLMKNIRLCFAAGAPFVMGAVLAGSVVWGQDLPQTSADAHLSITHGFEQSSLALLRRVAFGPLDSVSGELLNKLCPAPCPDVSKSSPGNMIKFNTSHWSLELLGDGTAARYQNLDALKGPHALLKAYTQRSQATELEQAGHNFITSKLSSLITLGTDEKLVPVRTDYRIEGSYNLKTGDTNRSVVANRIVFGRTIHGVPIVGGGSTVVLTFTNDGSLESFRYDWPRYELADARSVVTIEELLSRVQRVVGMRAGVPLAASPPKVSPGNGATYTIDLMKNTVLRKLECGYYDPGFTARETRAVVQPGCVYHAVFQNEEGTRAAFAGAVPGTAQIELDASWAESVMLRGPQPSDKPSVPGSAHYP
jgi:hypothetical protein